MGKAEYKIPGGKLVIAETETVENKIQRIKITGDFFMHPEEAIEKLEKFLIKTQTLQEKIQSNIDAFFERNTVELIGVSPKDIAHVIELSLR
jgi:lipoate-protein ligase A